MKVPIEEKLENLSVTGIKGINEQVIIDILADAAEEIIKLKKSNAKWFDSSLSAYNIISRAQHKIKS